MTPIRLFGELGWYGVWVFVACLVSRVSVRAMLVGPAQVLSANPSWWRLDYSRLALRTTFLHILNRLDSWTIVVGLWVRA